MSDPHALPDEVEQLVAVSFSRGIEVECAQTLMAL
jgi:hypothetical protein